MGLLRSYKSDCNRKLMNLLKNKKRPKPFKRSLKPPNYRVNCNKKPRLLLRLQRIS